ncbi:MAG TPA: NosD domain-containing protein [Methanothrix sp.]|nr:NosD domain-containing protein [Methanothrix sp.]
MLRWTLAILIALSIGLVLGAEAKMYIVDDDGFAQYHSVGEALAVANDGDTIYVKPGTYREHIVLNKSVTLMPPRGEEGIISLAGDGSDIGIEVLADGCIIEGLTISDFAGPGIYAESESNQIRKNTLVNNVHGIYLNGSSGNLVENNQEDGGYCGIVIISSSDNAVKGNVARGCRGSPEVPGSGILLNSGSNNSISGCRAEGCGRGIDMRSESLENDISGSEVEGCGVGFLIEMGSGANLIRYSTVNNATTAIVLDTALKNLIQNNSITNSTNGIVLFSSTENGIVENRLSNLDVGLMISESMGNVFINNEIETANSGVLIKDSPTNRFEGNTLVGVRLGLNVESTGDGLNNQISESNQIDGDPILYLYNRSDGVISGREFGHVTIAGCENLTIEGSSITNDGLFLYSSRGCRILDNVVSNGYGMLIRDSDENEIRGNQACENRYGGVMLVDSDGNTIGENNLSKNEWDGLLLRGSDANKVLSNLAEGNREAGIRVLDSNDTEITGNSVIGNGFGIYVNGSGGCIVYRNNIIDNLVQAMDDGDNLWDWGALKGGNYWSDHSCEGSPCLNQTRSIGERAADSYPFGERDGWSK